MVVHSFSSDWLREWREFSGPITERSKDKPMQFRITFDTQLKIFCKHYSPWWYMVFHSHLNTPLELKSILFHSVQVKTGAVTG